MSGVSESGVEGIPEAARALFEEQYRQELRPPLILRKELADYRDSVETRLQNDASEADALLALQLFNASARLLGNIDIAMPEGDRRAIQAAIRYFIEEDDADPDHATSLGLDDDAEVMNAVLAHLGHDWRVEVPL